MCLKANSGNFNFLVRCLIFANAKPVLKLFAKERNMEPDLWAALNIELCKKKYLSKHFFLVLLKFGDMFLIRKSKLMLSKYLPASQQANIFKCLKVGGQHHHNTPFTHFSQKQQQHTQECTYVCMFGRMYVCMCARVCTNFSFSYSHNII